MATAANVRFGLERYEQSETDRVFRNAGMKRIANRAVNDPEAEVRVSMTHGPVVDVYTIEVIVPC